MPWLKEKYGYDVVCCLIDIGRVKDVPEIMARAEAAGAIAAVAIDAKEEFAEHHCLPALMANALYEGKYPLQHGHRPAAHRQEARGDGAQVTASSSSRRMHRQGQRSGPHGHRRPRPGSVAEIIAPARAADWPSREELLDYVAAHDIPVNLTKKSPYSIDEKKGMPAAATSAACSRTRGSRRRRTPSSS